MEQSSSYRKPLKQTTGSKEISKWMGREYSLRADVCKYRPEVGKMKCLKTPKKSVDYSRYSSIQNMNFSFIG